MHAAPADPSLTPALADIAEELTARIERGQPIDEATLARDYPEQWPELRQLLPTIRMLADLSRVRDHSAPALPQDVTGTLGDFRLGRLIGRGGMGDVYEAEQISLGRRVALKVLPFAVTLDTRQLQRFQNEARAAASLHHPHIVPVYAVGSDRGVHYFAMQYIDGPSLAECVRDRAAPAQPDKASTAVAQRSTLTDANPVDYIRQVARLGRDVADALEHAHSIGIVHRDIKPSNLLLDARGAVWVADFGLARSRHHDLTRSGDLVGTFRYMSPEQALAQHDLVDHRTDVYSLGATLYELLTLRPAVAGETQPEILRHIVHAEPSPPRALDPGIPVALETIVLKALAKEPAQRYATAGELAADLQRFVDDQPIKARRPTVAQRLSNWSRRHRALVRSALASFILILSCVAAAIAVSRARIQGALERERAGQYTLRLALARVAWGDGQVDDARTQLDACPPEYRDADWRELQALCHAEIAALPLPFDPGGMALDHQGRRAVVRAAFLNFVFVDLQSGTLSPIVKSNYIAQEMAFAADDRQLIAVHRQPGLVRTRSKPDAKIGGEVVRIWDVAEERLLSEWPYSPRTHVTIDSMARRVAGSQGRRVWVWDARTSALQAVLELEGERTVIDLAFDHGGERLAVAFTDEIQIWDVDAQRLVERLQNPPKGTTRVEFTPDGRRLVLLSITDAQEGRLHRLSVWERESERELFHLLRPDASAFPAISRDGRFLAWAIDRRIELIDAQIGAAVATLYGHRHAVRSVGFAPAGERLYSVGRDSTLRTWDIRRWTGQP